MNSGMKKRPNIRLFKVFECKYLMNKKIINEVPKEDKYLSFPWLATIFIIDEVASES